MLPCKLRLFVAHAVPPSSEHNKFSCVAKRRSNVFSLQHKNLLREVVVVVHNKKFQPATRHLLCHRLQENAAGITSSAETRESLVRRLQGKAARLGGSRSPTTTPSFDTLASVPALERTGCLHGQRKKDSCGEGCFPNYLAFTAQ